MINIDTTSVAVELKTILEGDNNYAIIYLAKDIALTQGITILGSKSEITIDGL